MTFEAVLHVAGAAMCLAVGALAIRHESRSLVQKAFLAGLGLLLLEAVAAALAAGSVGGDRLVWERPRLLLVVRAAGAEVLGGWIYLALMEALVDSPLVAGNKVVLLKDGPKTYASMFAAIAAARDHINMETYIFTDDEVGRRFADALIANDGGWHNPLPAEADAPGV